MLINMNVLKGHNSAHFVVSSAAWCEVEKMGYVYGLFISVSSLTQSWDSWVLIVSQFGSVRL